MKLTKNSKIKSTKINHKRFWKALIISTFLVCLILSLTVTAFAAGESGSLDNTMTKFLDILFSILKFVGVIAIAYGAVQLFMAISSHDASQRLQGIIFLAGGLIIFFVKNILELIGVTF